MPLETRGQLRGDLSHSAHPVTRAPLRAGVRPPLRVVNLADAALPERRSPRRCTYGMSGCPRRNTARKAARRSGSLKLWSARRRATTSAGVA